MESFEGVSWLLPVEEDFVSHSHITPYSQTHVLSVGLQILMCICCRKCVRLGFSFTILICTVHFQ